MFKDAPSTRVIVPSLNSAAAPRSDELSTTSLSLAEQIKALAQRDDQSASPGTISNVLAILGKPPSSRSDGDAWLSESLRVIKSFRGVRRGWDGRNARAPAAGTLDAAEMLMALLTTSFTQHRLQLMIDADGRPSFASSANGKYLHLVLEPAEAGSNEKSGYLSWYSVKGGEEDFKEAIPFDGREIPSALRLLVENP